MIANISVIYYVHNYILNINITYFHLPTYEGTYLVMYIYTLCLHNLPISYLDTHIPYVYDIGDVDEYRYVIFIYFSCTLNCISTSGFTSINIQFTWRRFNEIWLLTEFGLRNENSILQERRQDYDESTDEKLAIKILLRLRER